MSARPFFTALSFDNLLASLRSNESLIILI